MDWAVFHVGPQFVEQWVRHTRALKQRNAALKLQAGQASFWDPELARLGEVIGESRRRFLAQLQPYWRDAVAALSGLDVELHYIRGWSHDHTLLDALASSRARDEARWRRPARPHP